MEEDYVKKDLILFWGGGFGCFSNFSAYQVEYNGVLYPTSEHAYQAAKFTDEDLKEKVKNARSSYEAFMMTQDMKDKYRPDWYNVRVDIMEEIIRAKIDQHPHVLKKLRDSEDREIVEASHLDAFWGWGPNKDGENHLGKIWMKLRSELIK